MIRARRIAAAALAALATLGSAEAADRAVAPGHRLEVLVTGIPHVLDALEPFRGVLLVSVGAASPGGRLLQFALRRDSAPPHAGRSGDAVLWSRSRLTPLVVYSLTGRVHAGVPGESRIVQLAIDWTPDPLILGLRALHDLAFRSDGRLVIADGDRVLETPVYVVPPGRAEDLRILHRCAGACRGVALGGAGETLVLEADGDGGRVVRIGGGVVAVGLPPPGAGLRRSDSGDLFFPSQAGVLRIRPDGSVTAVLSGLAEPGRVNVDPDGNLLVTDPAGGELLRIRIVAP